MIFEIIDSQDEIFYSETYFSIGGGFVLRLREIEQIVAPLEMESSLQIPFPFGSGKQMIKMARKTGMKISQLKSANEREYQSGRHLASKFQPDDQFRPA